MRLILFALLFAETAAIVYLTHIMIERPFSNGDMRTSYYNGCNLGQFHINSLSFTCSSSADSYKEELERLDKFMDKVNE